MAPPKTDRRNVCQNRKARHEYDLSDFLEVGIMLLGSEVKSLRQGKASLDEAWVKVDARGATLMDAHIAPYVQANQFNHDPVRPRPLLLNQHEIDKLRQKVREKGLTVVPIQLYFKGPWCKLEIAVGRGRQQHDKRHALREQQDKREAQRALRGR